MTQKVPFIVTELPNADPCMLYIHAALAEQGRPREALAAAKRRGQHLGDPKIGELDRLEL
jgi:hypothetical protein